jgi:hypothetical protein
VIAQAQAKGLTSDEHFTVDGTLVEAWASLKSFQRKDKTNSAPPDDPGNPTVDFHGEQRSNQTHQSQTDAEALLARKAKGKEAKLCFSAHVLMENRNGLCVGIAVAPADGRAEVREGVKLIEQARESGFGIRTVGADKGYDQRGFVDPLRAAGVTPHVAAKASCSAVDYRTTRHQTYAISQRCRKKVEEIFGWMKVVGGLRRTRFRGVQRTGLCAYLVAAAYNLVRLSRLQARAG